MRAFNSQVKAATTREPWAVEEKKGKKPRSISHSSPGPAVLEPHLHLARPQLQLHRQRFLLLLPFRAFTPSPRLLLGEPELLWPGSPALLFLFFDASHGELLLAAISWLVYVQVPHAASTTRYCYIWTTPRHPRKKMRKTVEDAASTATEERDGQKENLPDQTGEEEEEEVEPGTPMVRSSPDGLLPRLPIGHPKDEKEHMARPVKGRRGFREKGRRRRRERERGVCGVGGKGGRLTRVVTSNGGSKGRVD
ncbi:hypothetical protein BHE74_00056014 [Ensete ventricosum]|nr:hypothetical protein BHE74_00056014 [Ensete ventricosum]